MVIFIFSDHQSLAVLWAASVSFLGTLVASLGRSLLSPSPAIPVGGIFMANSSSSLLKQLELAAVTLAESELEGHKAQIVTTLQTGGVQAASFLSTELKTLMKGNSLLSKLEGPILETIVSNIATQAVSGMGGESEALYALVDREFHTWAASLGGK